MWDKVYEGQEVQHSAKRENAVSDLLNQFPAMSGKNLHGCYGQVLSLTGFSQTGIAAGMPVAIGTANHENVCEVTPLPGKTDFWGICVDTLEETITGKIIIHGIARANITIENLSHRFAKLSEGTLISCAESTDCRILTQLLETGEQLCTVFLRQNGNEIQTAFAVTLEEDGTLSVSGGYLNRNGTFLTVDPAEKIQPENGTLCLRSVLEENSDSTQWSAPAFVFCHAACNAWPVAEVTVTQENGMKKISIRQRITNVAMILQTKPCPLTTLTRGTY